MSFHWNLQDTDMNSHNLLRKSWLDIRLSRNKGLDYMENRFVDWMIDLHKIEKWCCKRCKAKLWKEAHSINQRIRQSQNKLLTLVKRNKRAAKQSKEMVDGLTLLDPKSHKSTYTHIAWVRKSDPFILTFHWSMKLSQNQKGNDSL